ncbi:hypothetical protein L226DRAFT_346543 [Lentinus tigrinus ALCF2SS1-7]|uniref:uncharacterized protein n=1 Tax=Lentinus tigrinus ALCF2SS1-7 TaxID=1328758 RepID=UPI00116616FC|nr:hypothetical protein L226DRAFT_346543 [Lentinus tigrinus ALCF2SS1-7]
MVPRVTPMTIACSISSAPREQLDGGQGVHWSRRPAGQPAHIPAGPRVVRDAREAVHRRRSATGLKQLTVGVLCSVVWGCDGAGDLDEPDVVPIWERMSNKSTPRPDVVKVRHDIDVRFIVTFKVYTCSHLCHVDTEDKVG